ncbi:MAG: RNA 2',3'-cyclic phosphodiesterase [Nitrospinae bacterium]|nr:RNA 2',3'-cyclic phosphodiesterase [Nitrospinota bacterium]
MRTFIAIDIPPSVVKAITVIQNRFKSLGLHASWVRPGNIHLTLKFLGDIDPNQVPGIRDKITVALAPLAPIEVSLDRVGVFPDLKRPRVLWVGLKDEKGALETLHFGLEQALASAGFPADLRPFSPHLTLARIKSRRGTKELQNELDALLSEGIAPNPFPVGSVQLYESQLTPKGSIYTVLANFKLNP